MFVSVRLKKATIVALCLLLVILITLGVKGPETVKESVKKITSVEVPVISYNNIVKEESLWGDDALSPVELEKDIIWLLEHGYETVSIGELISYVNGTSDLPGKPVVLTFDDGYYSSFCYVLPLLEKYKIKATVSVVGSYSEFACEEASPSPLSSYLDWEDIIEMRKTGLVEFANQTYDLNRRDDRKGVAMLENETYEDYRHIFLTDVFKTQHLLEENCKFSPCIFTYPFGISCEAGERLVKNSGFQASLSKEPKINYLSRDNEACLYNMGRFNRPAFVSTEDFMKGYEIE